MRADMSEMVATSIQGPVEGPNGTQPRKRPRPVISCLRCREKKLKCDRVTPCENCAKAGCPAGCVYNQGSNSVSKAKRVRLSSTTFDQQGAPRGESGGGAGIGIIEDLQQRVLRLEERLSLGSRVANTDLDEDASVLQISNDPRPCEAISESEIPRPFLGTLVVKGTRTRYHGHNNRISLLNQFPQAKEFIAQCSENSTIVGLAREVQFLQGKLPRQLDSPASTVDGESSPELVQLRVSLPAKSICDRLLRTYTDNFEKIFRIIHVPSFLREYAQFWTEPDHELYRSSAFIPQLTAICTISLALDGQRTKMNDSDLWQYLNGPAITLIQLWLQNLTRKRRTELATLQVETLILLSRRLRLVPPEELWKATGTLIRSAMVMGLHLNLARCTELSVFQAQVRRRLWITIVEMDLEASIACGMPVMTSPHDVGPPPANINDSDFDESTSELPPAKGLSDLTDSLYQVSLATSLADRLRAMSVVRMAREQTDLDELVQQGGRIVEHLRQIPRLLKLGEAHMDENDPAMLLNCVLLDVYTRRPLLCLYRPVVLGEPRDDPVFPEICRISLESSLAILSYQDNFDPSVADPEVCNLGAYWDLFQIFCKNDILWDALSVCGYIKQSSQRSIFDSRQSGRVALGSSMHNKASLTRIVENTLDSLTARISEAGSNLKDILLLAVVLQSVRVRGATQAQEERMSQGASKALSACRQHLLPAVAEGSFGLNLTDFAQMLPTTQPMFTPDGQGSFTPSTQLHLPEDFLAQSSALAMEFGNFHGDPFIFGDDSFTWNV
ncbi:hypothetical protein BDV27DRAFT_125068 [Aspergillus caelatus]|uniref:Zn(2)-C6 fungal-type domain-containing protein n=1 Tax=Aspergillus caelatus TaxID=61420 RepID=A0A5N7AA73_9EURO|nr:uncharacterized protein BDV27DRAFT_125068 [Aspergillus caelatus]KAE8366615.1 hypothetical protein BDV27DRAFT_125068 [Aspergillus caelatus]